MFFHQRGNHTQSTETFESEIDMNVMAEGTVGPEGTSQDVLDVELGRSKSPPLKVDPKQMPQPTGRAKALGPDNDESAFNKAMEAAGADIVAVRGRTCARAATEAKEAIKNRETAIVETRSTQRSASEETARSKGGIIPLDRSTSEQPKRNPWREETEKHFSLEERRGRSQARFPEPSSPTERERPDKTPSPTESNQSSRGSDNPRRKSGRDASPRSPPGKKAKPTEKPEPVGTSASDVTAGTELANTGDLGMERVNL